MSDTVDISVAISEDQVSISTTEVGIPEINAIPNVIEVNVVNSTTINPLFYDLSEFTNTSLNPFIRTSGLSSYVPTSRTLTINGTTQDLSANRTFTVSTGITIGTSAITSGTVGRVLFEGAGNVVQESANLFWDNTNNRLGIGGTPGAFTLDVNGTARVSGALTTVGGVFNTGSNPSIGSAALNFGTMFLINLRSGGDLQLGSGFSSTGDNGLKMFSTTRNIVIQNGGTFTDAGFRLDVIGTTRLNGLQTFQGTTASDTAPLGAELAAVTGTGTNWTLVGTNLNVGGYTHTVGSVVPLTTTLAAVSGTYYQITSTITGRTAGSVTVAYGGISFLLTASGNTGPLATTTGVLTITPTSDFDGNVVLSIKSIGVSSASSTFANSLAGVPLEIRASDITTNSFLGRNSGRRNTTGNNNTFLGNIAGQNNTTANNNTFIGSVTGSANTTGSNNVFVGANAGSANTTGSTNTAVGSNSLTGNTTGTNNAAFGNQSLQSLTTGSFNTAFGGASLQLTTTSSSNTALGYQALLANTTGTINSAFGREAGRYIADKTTAAATSSNSLFLGYRTSPLADSQTNQIVIGHDATGLGSNTTILGNSATLVTAIYGNLLLGTTTNGASKLRVVGLPTSPTGLSSGDVWNNSGILTIV